MIQEKHRRNHRTNYLISTITLYQCELKIIYCLNVNAYGDYSS